MYASRSIVNNKFLTEKNYKMYTSFFVRFLENNTNNGRKKHSTERIWQSVAAAEEINKINNFYFR